MPNDSPESVAARMPDAMPILMYHRVADDGPESLLRWRVTPADFERQMAYLADGAFRVVPMSQWSDGGNDRERTVVLTFDDAYLDFMTTALPVLLRHRFGATLFVPTGYIGGHADWDVEFGPPAALLSWDQLGLVADGGIELGAHTITHPRLTQRTADQIRHEVTQSRDVLEARFGRPVTTFAYPYGDHNDRARDIVQDSGFATAVTIAQEPWTPFSLPRVEIAGGDSIEAFAEKVRR